MLVFPEVTTSSGMLWLTAHNRNALPAGQKGAIGTPPSFLLTEQCENALHGGFCPPPPPGLRLLSSTCSTLPQGSPARHAQGFCVQEASPWLSKCRNGSRKSPMGPATHVVPFQKPRCCVKKLSSSSNKKPPQRQLGRFSGGRKSGHRTPLIPFAMTRTSCRANANSRNCTLGVVQTFYTVPSESPDSERLSGPVWCGSGLTLQGRCRLYCGDHWRSGTITATGIDYALIRTKEGTSRCTDRRNLQTTEEARLFKNAQARFRRQRDAVLSRLETALDEEASDD